MNKGRIADRALWDYCSTDRELCVCGVFSAGIYFADRGGRVLMLHDSRCGTLPFGIAVEGLGSSGHSLGIENEAAVQLRGRTLLIPSAGLRIPLVYEPQPGSPTFAAPDGFLCAARSALIRSGRSVLQVYAASDVDSVRREDIGDPFAAAARKGMLALARSMPTADGKGIGGALDGLLGLGRGLTPSCDDFVTGLLFALGFYAERTGRAHPALDVLRSSVRERTARTNRYAAAYLLAAADGGDFSLLRRCLEAADADSFNALLAVGASSGADMLAGMCFAAAQQKLAYELQRI